MESNVNTCSVCGSSKLTFVRDYQPYIDKDWVFKVYDCGDCGARFTGRSATTNYHEMLYNDYVSYKLYYFKANSVADFLKKGQLFWAYRFLAQSNYYKAIIDFVEENDSKKQLSILEIGSSTGFLTAYLRAKGHNVTGVDISEKAVTYSRNTFGDFFYTEVPAGSFDIIFSCGTIGCVDAPTDFLSFFESRLNSGGKIYLNAPCVSYIPDGQIWMSTPPPDLITIFSKQSFNFVASKLGMGVRFSETGNNILKAADGPKVFTSEASSVAKAKSANPILSIIISLLKQPLAAIRNWLFPKMRVSQYGLLVELYKQADR